MKNMSFVIGAICLAFILWIAVDPPMVTAAVEDASWGEVKSQQIYRAAKATDHDGTESVVPTEQDIIGEWTSRRWNENDELEDVHYVFRADKTVTLTQTLEGTDQPSPPLHGTWTYWKEQEALEIIWEGGKKDNWIQVRLHHKDAVDGAQEVLDYKYSEDKEERTLEQAASPPPPRNWLVELTPDPEERVVHIEEGMWEGFDFEVLAADGHLPDYVRVHIEYDIDGRLGRIHVLDKKRYYGTEGRPQVNLCAVISNSSNSPDPRRWNSDRDLDIELDDAKGGFYITGCGNRPGDPLPFATIKIYSPHAVNTDEPLESFNVEID